MEPVPNRRCPKCVAVGRDRGNDAGHLYMAEDGANWICGRVDLHEDKQYCVIKHNPETGGPVCYDGDVSQETKVEPEGDTFGNEPAFDWGAKSTPNNRVDPVEFRGVPPDVLKKYGIEHEVNADGGVSKVFYPMYDRTGKQTDWKVRDVASKKFHSERCT